MPMPHRTFAQVAKRRLTGKEGRERIREVQALIAELPDYRNGPYADLRKWLLSEIEDTRVRSNAVHRDSIAVRREGAAQIALVGPPNVGKSSLLQALSEIQIKTGDYPFTTLRPVPALTRIGGVLVQLVEIPGLIGGAADDRGGGRALLGVLRTADAIVYCCRASADTAELATVIAEVAAAGIEKPAVLAVTRADEADPRATERIKRAFPNLPVVTVSILDDRSLDAFREAVWALTGLIRVRLRHDGDRRRRTTGARPRIDRRGCRRLGPPRSRRELHRGAGVGNVGPVRRAACRPNPRGRRRRCRGDPHVSVPREDPIVAFYLGEGRDGAGRTIDDVWAFSTAELEATHDFIQWLFPLRDRSAFVPGAPTLTDEAIGAFRDFSALRDRLIRSLDVMLAFYGLRRAPDAAVGSDDVTIEPAADLAVRGPQWWSAANHNHRRLTRIIASLSTLGLEPEARAARALSAASSCRTPHGDLRGDDPVLGEGRRTAIGRSRPLRASDRRSRR